MTDLVEIMEMDELSSCIKSHLLISSLPPPPSPSPSLSSEMVVSDDKNKSKKKTDGKKDNNNNNKQKKKNKDNNKKEDSASVETAAGGGATSKPKPEAKKYDRWNLLDSNSIDYGYYAQNAQQSPSSSSSSPPSSSIDYSNGGYYITTAINYTNGPAHMGHAYEAVTSDVIARYNRLRGVGSVTVVDNNNNEGKEDVDGDGDGDGGEGDDSKKKEVQESVSSSSSSSYKGYDVAYFLTGSDEHGEKIAKTAEGEGLKPIDICDKYVKGFQCLNQRLLISNDDYLRTTSNRHKETARELWNKCSSNDDIYLGKYSGWYNIREETFVTESDAKLNNYKDPINDIPLKKVEETSYFFKMSNYHDDLVNYIMDNPKFIQPDFQRNLILSRLKKDRLRDLSISRASFNWGVRVPDKFDQDHVMYVWIDALSNYLTGVDALQLQNFEHVPNLDKLWPANVHIIGKDIIWFHTVIWPTILMSAGVELPITVFAHGFVNDKNGKKMSKSVGNVINPHDMLDKYTVDTFRWYMCKEAPYGGELSFSEESLRTMHNADLCDTLGNLVHRATNLTKKNCNGLVPDVLPSSPDDNDDELPINFKQIRNLYITKMDKFELENGANIIMSSLRDLNGWLTNKQPWHLKGDEYILERQGIVRTVLETVYVLIHLLIPFCPQGCKSVFYKLNTKPKKLLELNCNLRNLQSGTEIRIGGVLYEKILSDEEISDAQKQKSNKAEEYAQAQKLKKEKKQKEAAKNKKAVAAAAAASSSSQANDQQQLEFTKLDIRVGLITKAWYHPDADKLFCEEINVGGNSAAESQEDVRQIASGLRQYYTLEEFTNQKVLVVCNLKPSKIIGFISNGMVLAAKNKENTKVELINPPKDARIGERIFLDLDSTNNNNDDDDNIGVVVVRGEPFSPAQVKKKKIFENVAKDLITMDEGIASWKGMKLMTSVGPCKANTLVGASIS